ncbi:MAG: TAXI family TRAP transporter solute-binding subunit [Desulfobacterales bacterium]|nr:TAXI family TRAP transporter solute-binding subunit [Desulfobacterales bacterium]
MKGQKAFRVSGIIFVGLLFLALTVWPGQGWAKQPSLRLAANVVGSLMYAVGGGLAGVVEKNSPLKVEILPQGNIIALPMFSTKECDLLLAATDEADMAYRGLSIYEKMTRGKGIDMRMIMIGNPIEAGILVAKDSGIKTGADLKGKRVTLDFGTHFALTMGARACLIGLGLTDKDVVGVKTTEVPAGMRLVLEGKADACFGAIGVPAFRELEAARGALYLGLDSNPYTWKKIRKEFFVGYFPAHVKPSPVNIGVVAPMILLGKNFSLVSRPDLSDEVVYTMTKTLWEHEQELGPYHPRLKGWKKANYVSTNSPIPYHSAAIKFYKEVGVWTEEMDKHQQELLALKK